MAELANLPDLLQDAAAFRAQYLTILADKSNRNPAIDEDDAALRPVAEWGDFVDGAVVVLQEDYAERLVTGRVRIGATTIHRVTATPEGALAAPVGDVAIQTDGTVWAKTSGGSTSSGWTEVGGGGAVAITDGTTSVSPATSIELDPAFFEVSDGGGGAAGITLADRSARSVLGVAGASAAAPADIVAGADGTFLGRSGGVLSFQSIAIGSLPNDVGRVISTSVTPLDFQDTNENDLLLDTLAANVLDINGRRVIAEIDGDTHNTGSSRNGTLRIYVGGVICLQDQWAFASLNARRPWRLTVQLTSISQSVQAVRAFLVTAAQTPTAPTTGVAGTFSNSTSGQSWQVIGNDSAADRTASIDLRVSLTHDTATANFRTRTQGWVVRRI